MSSFKFKRDDAGIADVLTGPDVGRFLTDIARQAAERIKRFGPGPRAFMEYGKTVRYVPAQHDGDGLAAHVGVDSPVWHLPEYGTSRYPARAPIRRGVADVGIELKENGR